MAVQIDKAGHDIHAGGIDLTRGAARFAIRLQRQARGAGAADFGDAALPDDDVGGALGRAAIAGDDGGAADDEQGIGAIGGTCHPRRSWQHARRQHGHGAWR